MNNVTILLIIFKWQDGKFVVKDIIFFSEDAECPEDKIGPQCLFFCEYNLNSDFNCQGIKICHENGCMCAPGYLGDTCSTRK